MKRGEIRSILAATDLGPASDEVVRAAAALAACTGARLHLINALEIERLRRRRRWARRSGWRAGSPGVLDGRLTRIAGCGGPGGGGPSSRRASARGGVR